MSLAGPPPKDRLISGRNATSVATWTMGRKRILGDLDRSGIRRLLGKKGDRIISITGLLGKYQLETMVFPHQI